MDEASLLNLDAWTYETIVEIVRTKQLEPARFEYRAVLNPERGDPEKLNERLRKTVCAMANTDGGYVIFGVRDRSVQVAKPENRVVGIPAAGDLLKEFGEKLKGIRLQPFFEATTRPISLPADACRALFAIHIPLSPRRPHEVDGTFYRRNEGGFNEPMDYHQVRDQMLLTEERLRKVSLLRLEIGQVRKQYEIATQSNTWHVLRFDTTSLKQVIADVSAVLPTRLMQTLLEIPLQAGIVNGHFERQARMGDNPPDRPGGLDVNGRLTNIAQLCQDCETRLAEIFGPLSLSD